MLRASSLRSPWRRQHNARYCLDRQTTNEARLRGQANGRPAAWSAARDTHCRGRAAHTGARAPHARGRGHVTALRSFRSGLHQPSPGRALPRRIRRILHPCPCSKAAVLRAKRTPPRPRPASCGRLSAAVAVPFCAIESSGAELGRSKCRNAERLKQCCRGHSLLPSKYSTACVTTGLLRAPHLHAVASCAVWLPWAVPILFCACVFTPTPIDTLGYRHTYDMILVAETGQSGSRPHPAPNRCSAASLPCRNEAVRTPSPILASLS